MNNECVISGNIKDKSCNKVEFSIEEILFKEIRGGISRVSGGKSRTPVAYARTQLELKAKASLAFKKDRTVRCQKKGAVTTYVSFPAAVTCRTDPVLLYTVPKSWAVDLGTFVAPLKTEGAKSSVRLEIPLFIPFEMLPGEEVPPDISKML